MKDLIYITGHRNPDSDSICASLGYADFKKQLGFENIVSGRLGELNNETKFVLDYFNVEAPTLIDTVKTQVSDLDIDKVTPISKDLSLKKAWTIMEENNVKTLPLQDEEGKLIGLASLSNISSTYMGVWQKDILAKSNANIEDIIDTLNAKIAYKKEEKQKFTGNLVVAAMEANDIKNYVKEGDIVILGNREDSQETALDCKAHLLVVTGSHKVSDKILNKAKDLGCSILISEEDTFTTSVLITQSIPVSYIMTSSDIISFKLSDFVEDIKEVMLKTRFRSYPVVDQNNKIVGTISRYHLISPKNKKVILVDHNEIGQSVPGLEEAEIMEIIDHHRIGGVNTASPIFFRNQPVGSTSTIIANMFFENNITPSKEIAGLLASAIISDTLLFKSPTSTELDKTILDKLAKIAEIDPKSYSVEMFKAGTSLKGKTVEGLFHEDFKNFTIGGGKIGVSQVSTMDPSSFDPLKKDMLNLMESKVKKEGYEGLILVLTDLLKEGSFIYVIGPKKEIIASAFGKSLDKDSSLYAEGVLSRKKQVIPPITNAIENK
ncbi:putative manganese-dependent inorganic diphosphatase [Clostridium botulinum]|uniref:putative manganese-dependent inorganic diphosphatase n=1 Tax=Clostridium botulinum TaxID=1491 RepID=UPI0001592069|nr:putative manganese-dependent inorganic diphosphatase [Clostridium botulinum]ABS32688.1 putative manganese-dependent inorganic pyrophosphatase [Clostridium botulinum A str. ATCC 19397]ABS38670.1 putative manganese-dependent inorganic pyrophosphatase [Clostridium botulinum A str. Hall]AWB18423.1 putative manganese-dependent inorganic diphosphatase [Clostridium botulinum]EGT5615413.1 putative manganese-dependent inorganic diphosphatase [Clostridium botulinum]EGT5622264.1 putative manganese-dep